MNRRQFLASLGIGLPSAVVAEKLGLVEKIRKYFFAPKGGWHHDVTLTRTWWEKDGIWQADIVGTHVLQIRRLDGLPYWADNWTGTYMGISRDIAKSKEFHRADNWPKVEFSKALLIGNS